MHVGTFTGTSLQGRYCPWQNPAPSSFAVFITMILHSLCWCFDFSLLQINLGAFTYNIWFWIRRFAANSTLPTYQLLSQIFLQHCWLPGLFGWPWPPWQRDCNVAVAEREMAAPFPATQLKQVRDGASPARCNNIQQKCKANLQIWIQSLGHAITNSYWSIPINTKTTYYHISLFNAIIM